MLSRARVLCNSAHVLLERAALEALDVSFLQRSLACSGRPLSRFIATAFVARSLISESAQHELQHLAFIARVRSSLSLSAFLFLCRLLSSSAGSASLSLSLDLSLSLRLSLRLSLSGPLSLRLSLPPRLSLRLRLSRSASSLNLRVCDNPSLRLSLSSFQPRLYSYKYSRIVREHFKNNLKYFLFFRVYLLTRYKFATR